MAKEQLLNSQIIILLSLAFLIGLFSQLLIKGIIFLINRKKCSHIDIKNKNSTATISIHFLSEIIKSSFADRKDIIIKRVYFHKNRNFYFVNMNIKLANTCNINETTKEIEETVLKKLNLQLGAECIETVFVHIKDIFQLEQEREEEENQPEDNTKEKKEEDDDNDGWT